MLMTLRRKATVEYGHSLFQGVACRYAVVEGGEPVSDAAVSRGGRSDDTGLSRYEPGQNRPDTFNT
jgi:hypothetical protein